MKEIVKVGLLGLGTVGGGVYKIIRNHQEELCHRIGSGIEIKKILIKNEDKKREVDSRLLTKNSDDVLADPDIDIVIEVMGGIEESKRYILEALRQKKHVITANKDLMALYGSELHAFALENGCDLFYEASVGGGIPIIRSLVDGLASDRINKLVGIVNGTTNFILTKMTKEGADYNSVLKEAQRLGFAESDPSGDVEGLDAARKMVILSQLGFHMRFNLSDVYVEGITKIKPEDIDYAAQLGYTIKLVGIAQRDQGEVEISVQPALLPNEHPLASVNNEYNAVYIYGDAIGETMFYGPGAGQFPTATSVVSDLVAVARNMHLGINGQHTVLPHYETHLKKEETIFSKFFLRFHVKDQAGAFSQITALFAENGISLEKLIQEPIGIEGLAEVVIITHRTNRASYTRLISQLNDLDIVDCLEASYRVEGE
ncbi:homoserine dehydrogenase [Pullulanibacillus sp. KACC 23026]|uniref:homoserine dehydrogenase n=1 Tax=Pullulanibacillus sp. KACC 23026 TaxID=3028315 RepID=UPI0023B1986C|nr:homoserine dehydrogenase [Pullulanibacillus sp. KACC 23026]WEG10830.1 homoserine dehydrogenase [Pullulanibacillus sp. KACC 23026]